MSCCRHAHATMGPPPTRPATVRRQPHYHQEPKVAEAKVAMLKDLKKMRKTLNEKVENALTLKTDIELVNRQMRSIGDAFDTLSQVVVDELDYIRGDMARTKVDMVDQLTTLAKSFQVFPAEIAVTKSVSESANDTARKAKHVVESGIRRLNEVISVQQQALGVLDNQQSAANEQLHEFKSELKMLRQDSTQRGIECDQMRQEVTAVRGEQEGLMVEYRQHLHAMQAAGANYEHALAERETRAAMQLQDYARVEAELQELGALFESRMSAFERNRRETPKSTTQAEARVKDLEFEVSVLKKQLNEQEQSLREMQRQLSKNSERTVLSVREQHQIQDLIAKAVHDHMLRNPSKPPLSSSTAKASLLHSRVETGIDVSRGSPQHMPTLGADAADDLFTSPGMVGRPLDRVMLTTRRGVGQMKQESEMRHAALTRAVADIDERIRASTSAT